MTSDTFAATVTRLNGEVQKSSNENASGTVDVTIKEQDRPVPTACNRTTGKNSRRAAKPKQGSATSTQTETCLAATETPVLGTVVEDPGAELVQVFDLVSDLQRVQAQTSGICEGSWTYWGFCAACSTLGAVVGAVRAVWHNLPGHNSLFLS
mmetsp:Transcript_14706/g.41398  ORF Transcript_14706/g.41398 Transcript_14706/m.41398 type:complete len:152 (+) Transcript_14706:188-643(+)